METKDFALLSKEEIIQRIRTLLKEPSLLNNWETNFLSSVNDQFNKWGNLSHSQSSALDDIYKRCGPDALSHKEIWDKDFDESKREILKICSEYYLNTSYYNNTAIKVLEDESFIPTESVYKGMCENKYALAIITERKAAPKYEVGSMVQLRSFVQYSDVRHLYNIPSIRGGTTPGGVPIGSASMPKLRATSMYVVEAGKMVPKKAYKNNKIYKVLPFGFSEMYLFEERHLKGYRVPKAKKKKS